MEMTINAIVYGLTSLVLVRFLVLLGKNYLLSPSPKLPPGPWPLPIVGNLLMIRKYPSMQEFANHLKRRYGPIVSLWMGSKLLIIVSGPEIIQEAMITQGSNFAARNQLESTRILKDNHRALATGNGERHRFIRKLMVSGVLTNKRLAEFRPIRDQEVDILLDSLKKQLKENGGIVSNFRSLVRLTVCNFIVGILFGRRLTLEEYADLDDVMVRTLLIATGKPRDFMPLLALLPDRKGVKAQLEMRRQISEILEPLIEERKKALQSGKSDKGATFVDTLLGLREGEIASPVEILDSDVVLLCIELITAGTDTTALNLEYCIANLINHQEIQEKLAQEISAVVGETVVNEEDLPQLPYLQAVVKESLRRHSPARMAPTRKALAATKIAGYDIPVNTSVLQHLEGVALNAEIWEEPLEFRPERFLNKTVDLTGSTGITMIPFGVGRRICPAINVALLHEEIIVARLIQAFQWKTAKPGELLDLSPGKGLSAPMNHELVTSLQERVLVS